jgi:omega-6 fatty acid desaturase (delta-12 desaturase)
MPTTYAQSFLTEATSLTGPQKATGSMERDENYVPYTRSKFNLPPESKATSFDYAEVFEETPFFTLFRMTIMQTL